MSRPKFDQRAHVALPFVCGDEATQRAAEDRVRALRATIGEGRAIVAPGAVVATRGGVLLHCPAEVRASDVADMVDRDTGELLEVGALRYLRLVERGFIIEAL